MRIRSSLPVTMAGINNRQMKSNTMSAVNNQPMGDTLSISPAFQGDVKIVGGVKTLRKDLRSANVSEKTIEAIVDLFLGKSKKGFRAAAKANGVDIKGSSEAQDNRAWLRVSVKTDDKSYYAQGNNGDGFVRDERSHHDPISIKETTTPERAIEKVTAVLEKLVRSHNQGRKIKYVG